MDLANPDSMEVEEEEEERNWLELPSDVMSLIFMKVGAIELLLTVQRVCSTWRKFCKEPELWCSIDMRNPWASFNNNDDGDYDIKKMAMHAVNRSCGLLIEFSMESFGTDEVLKCITDQSSPLRCLRLISCSNITNDGLIKAAGKFPLLEELELSSCSFSKEVYEAIGLLCPRLKSLHLNYPGWPNEVSDEDAFTIAKNMPGLHHLQLIRSRLTNTGVKAIIEGCTHLESLDLRECFYLDFSEELRKRCANTIKCLKVPDDPVTPDYENVDDGFFDRWSSDGYPYGFSDSDILSDGYPYGFSDSDILSDDVYYEFSDGDEEFIF